MIAKLISEPSCVCVLDGNEDFNKISQYVLPPVFKTLQDKIATDLVSANLTSRHLVRVVIQVHAEENPSPCKK